MQADRGPVAILAGAGRLPELMADRLRRGGRDCRVLAFRGFANATLRRKADAVVDLLDVKRALACLQTWRPSAVTLAGGLQRPRAGAVLNAFSAFRNRQELSDLMGRGDDQLLRGVVRLLEEKGMPVVGVLDLAPELLAPAGVQTARAPEAQDQRSIMVGLRLLRDLSPYDIGQAAVVSGERVLAVEGPEGTDHMLARVQSLGRSWILRQPAEGGVLVKVPKEGQDLRVDLPAIGPRTVVRAAKAGLSGIAVASGRTLIVDRDETVRLCSRYGLFLLGVPQSPLAPAGASG
jgi:UDP-2,3-diacylglucosamine hydrolase